MPALVTCFGIPIDICVRKAVRCLLVFSASHTSLFMSFCFSDTGTFSPLCGRGGGGRGAHLLSPPRSHPFSNGSLSLKELPACLGSRVSRVHLSEQGCFRRDRLSYAPGTSPLLFPSPGVPWSPFPPSLKGVSSDGKPLVKSAKSC